MSVYGFQQTSVYISFRTFQSVYINAIFYLFVALHKKNVTDEVYINDGNELEIFVKTSGCLLFHPLV